MNIVRWNPFTEMVSLREAMDRVFEDSFVGLRPFTWPLGDGMPLVDVYQTENDVVVKATVPGLAAEEVDVTIQEDTLTIRGETKSEVESKGDDRAHHGRRYGSFYQQVTLPVPIVVEKAAAMLENGILTVTLPKAAEVMPKRIKVNVNPVLEQPKTEKKSKK